MCVVERVEGDGGWGISGMDMGVMGYGQYLDVDMNVHWERSSRN